MSTHLWMGSTAGFHIESSPSPSRAQTLLVWSDAPICRESMSRCPRPAMLLCPARMNICIFKKKKKSNLLCMVLAVKESHDWVNAMERRRNPKGLIYWIHRYLSEGLAVARRFLNSVRSGCPKAWPSQISGRAQRSCGVSGHDHANSTCIIKLNIQVGATISKVIRFFFPTWGWPSFNG